MSQDRSARWARAETELRAALAHLRPLMDRPSTVWIEEFLDHNELGLAMDALVDAALASAADPPNEVSNHLRAASAEMKGYKPSTWDRFIARLE